MTVAHTVENTNSIWNATSPLTSDLFFLIPFSDPSSETGKMKIEEQPPRDPWKDYRFMTLASGSQASVWRKWEELLCEEMEGLLTPIIRGLWCPFIRCKRSHGKSWVWGQPCQEGMRDRAWSLGEQRACIGGCVWVTRTRSLGGMNWPRGSEWTLGRRKPQAFSETQWHQSFIIIIIIIEIQLMYIL